MRAIGVLLGLMLGWIGATAAPAPSPQLIADPLEHDPDLRTLDGKLAFTDVCALHRAFGGHRREYWH